MPLPLRSTVAERLLSGAASRRIWLDGLNIFAATVGQNRSSESPGEL